MKILVIKTTTLITTEVFRVYVADSPSHYPTITDRAITEATASGLKADGIHEERTVKFQVMEAK